MEELDLKELFNIFWSKKIQILLIILIFAVVGVIYTIGFVTPMYSSSTSLVLTSADSSSADATNSITTTDVTLNSKLVSTYSVIVKSKKVLRQVISNLQIDVEEESLRRNVTVSSVEDTELIEITVTNENATYAAKIANEIAKVFSEEVTKIYKINNIHILDEAEVSGSPSNINHMKDVIIFTFIGIVVAVAYVLLNNMLDTTIKSPEEVEKNFGIPVLVSIPLIESFDNEKGKGGRK